MNQEWGAGDRAKWSDHGKVKVGGSEYKLIYGEHPHSRRDNQHYALMHGEPVGFDGMRVLFDVQVESRNYLKTSGISGEQVRAQVTTRILANGVQVYEFFRRDPQTALLEAHRLITQISEHPVQWWCAQERSRLVGRKIFYREVPAVIESLIVDQGCVMIRSDDGSPFPPPVWRSAEDHHDPDNSVKVDVLADANVWWWRD